MNSKVETQGSRLDSFKLTAAIAVLLIAVVAFYFFEGQVHPVVRVLGLLVATGIAIAIALQTEKGRSIAGFIGDARTEVRKVVWPSRAETVQTSLMVFLLVIILGIFLWGLDALLLWAVRWLTGQGG
jgi:preprotein translocase subunit SecE